MQLKLSENIKRYRKDLGLTQDELAEALGVTIGAVSKWENGNNVPDITTMMELANLFNISMDELLSYNKSSKNIDAMVKTIDELCDDHIFDEAVAEANSALIRYPHTFKIVYACAKMYTYKYVESGDEKDCDRAIELMNRSREYLSQNEDSTVTDFTIRMRIAELYRKRDPEKALSELRSINYQGCNNIMIAQILLDTGKREECLELSTMVLLQGFAYEYQLITNMAIAVASTGKKGDMETAVELIDMEMALRDQFSVDDPINYTHKLKTVSLILKAWWLSGLGEYERMKECVREAYDLAVLYDKSEGASDLSRSFRFYFSKKKTSVFDSVGTSAVAGIESMFEKKQDLTNKKTYKYMGKVIEYWNKLKGM